ncbi:hypothetical protein [Streptomyces inhibens]|uniref:hypothetical protein n=1 Tax=Streptomyces inhibens TaxID=2293571 RepID=UPI001EE6E769|nr:hypothetical protein [Streptomyces inhibens]UKY54037.1 hypothetical protein KI385_38020 [Streptomyces inhibens]
MEIACLHTALLNGLVVPVRPDLGSRAGRGRTRAPVNLVAEPVEVVLRRDVLPWHGLQKAVVEGLPNLLFVVIPCGKTLSVECGVGPEMGTDIPLGPTGQKLLPLWVV